MTLTAHPSSNAPVCVCVRVCYRRAPPQAGASELEVISQQVEEDNQCPVQLVSFAYRDLPLAGLDVSLAGSQLISNPDDEDNREGYVPLRHTHTPPVISCCFDSCTTVSEIHRFSCIRNLIGYL